MISNNAQNSLAMKEINLQGGKWYDIYFPGPNEKRFKSQEKQTVLKFGGINSVQPALLDGDKYDAVIPFGTLRFLKTIQGLSTDDSPISKEISKKYGPKPLPQENFIQSYREYLESQGLKINTMFYRVTESDESIKNELSKLSITLAKNTQDTKTFETKATDGVDLPKKKVFQNEPSQYLRQVSFFSYGWQNIEIKSLGNKNFFFGIEKEYKNVEFLELKGTFQQIKNDDFVMVKVPLGVKSEKSSTTGSPPVGVSAYFIEPNGSNEHDFEIMREQLLKVTPTEGATILIPKIKLMTEGQFTVSTSGSNPKTENIGLASFGTVKTAIINESITLCVNEQGIKGTGINDLIFESNESSNLDEIQSNNPFISKSAAQSTLEFNHSFYVYISDDLHHNAILISV
ncbi:hypothetical protein HMI56_000386 [Coelomomyces lativittatus]|nr:hypothetical protein HMI56_000386 [Coelomomyces lativittatus]